MDVGVQPHSILLGTYRHQETHSRSEAGPLIPPPLSLVTRNPHLVQLPRNFPREAGKSKWCN